MPPNLSLYSFSLGFKAFFVNPFDASFLEGFKWVRGGTNWAPDLGAMAK